MRAANGDKSAATDCKGRSVLVKKLQGRRHEPRPRSTVLPCGDANWIKLMSRRDQLSLISGLCHQLPFRPVGGTAGHRDETDREPRYSTVRRAALFIGRRDGWTRVITAGQGLFLALGTAVFSVRGFGSRLGWLLVSVSLVALWLSGKAVAELEKAARGQTQEIFDAALIRQLETAKVFQILAWYLEVAADPTGEPAKCQLELCHAIGHAVDALVLRHTTARLQRWAIYLWQGNRPGTRLRREAENFRGGRAHREEFAEGHSAYTRLDQRRALIVEDVDNPPDGIELDLPPDAPYKALISVPIVSETGRTFGLLNCDTDVRRSLTEADGQICIALAGLMAAPLSAITRRGDAGAAPRRD